MPFGLTNDSFTETDRQTFNVTAYQPQKGENIPLAVTFAVGGTPYGLTNDFLTGTDRLIFDATAYQPEKVENILSL